MKTTIELTQYPFNEDYRDHVKGFVAELEKQPGLKTSTGPTSTVITGEHSELIQRLDELMQWSLATQGRSAFVAKILLDYEPG